MALKEVRVYDGVPPASVFRSYDGSPIVIDKNTGIAYWCSASDVVSSFSVILPKTSGEGIKVDQAAPTFPRRDLEGPVAPSETGAGKPTFSSYRDGIKDWAFAANDTYHAKYHWPHDYVPGSDVFIHVHWSHNGTDISGSLVCTYEQTYSKGHQQDEFPATQTLTQTISSLNITNTPQYHHRIDEVQFSADSPSGGQMDNADLEPDGLLFVVFKPTTIPSVTGGSIFIHQIDIHYQSTNIGTKQKSPNFYT